MRDGFDFLRAVPEDAIQNLNYSKTKLTMPVKAVRAGYIPAFGGNVTINYALYGMQKLTQNVTGIKVPLLRICGFPEEPQTCGPKQFVNFFGGDNTDK